MAKRTSTTERYVREWLSGQAAADYVTYDAATGRYTLPDAHAAALTDDESPACVLGGFQGMTGAMRATSKVIEAFRSGGGSAGTSTTRICSWGSSASSGRCTWPIS